MHHLFATNAGIMPKELSGRMQWTPFTDKKMGVGLLWRLENFLRI
jgi:hypothetical protein